MATEQFSPSDTRRLWRFGSGALGRGMLVSTLVGVCCLCLSLQRLTPDQDAETRITPKLVELFEARIDLMLEDLALRCEFDGESMQRAKLKLHACAADFLTSQPPTIAAQDPFGRSPQMFAHKPFSALLDSDAWREALGAGLDFGPRALLIARREQREATLRAALMAQVERQVVEGLCLTEPERKGLGDVLAQVVDDRLKTGVIDLWNRNAFGQQSKQDLFGELVEAGLVEVLAEGRRPLVEDLAVPRKRIQLDDYLFEIEFFLGSMDAPERARRMLRGCATAVLQRDGKKPRTNNQTLVSRGGLEKDSFWNRTLRSVLEIPEDEELPTPPSRGASALVNPRARVLFAVLDLRACFTEEQREALMPLLEEFAENELKNKSRRGALSPSLPAAFGLNPEELYISSRAEQNNLSAKIKSMVETLFETCSTKQREVLDA